MGDWRDEAKARIKMLTQGSTIKLDEGINCLRVLPDKKDVMPDGTINPKGMTHSPVREIMTHSDVGPDKRFNLRCGHAITGEGQCWLCDAKIPELVSSGISSKRMQAEAMAPKKQLLVNASIFDRDAHDGKGGFSPAKPWWMGLQGQKSLGVRIYSRIVGSGLSKKDYVSPTKGHNINVERVGTGKGTTYPDIEGDETPSIVPKSVLIGMRDLDSIAPKYSAEDLKAAYFGRDPEEAEERPKKRRAEPEPEVEDAVTDDAEEPVDAEETDAAEEYSAEETEPDEDAEPESLEGDIPDEVEPEDEPEPEPEPVRRTAPAKKTAPPPARKTAPPPARRR